MPDWLLDVLLEHWIAHEPDAERKARTERDKDMVTAGVVETLKRVHGLNSDAAASAAAEHMKVKVYSPGANPKLVVLSGDEAIRKAVQRARKASRYVILSPKTAFGSIAISNKPKRRYVRSKPKRRW